MMTQVWPKELPIQHPGKRIPRVHQDGVQPNQLDGSERRPGVSDRTQTFRRTDDWSGCLFLASEPGPL